jgi:hypothetical protein
VLADAEAADDVVVDHDHPAAGDRPHGDFLPTGHPELANHEDAQRGAQRAGDLVGHRHATARQPQYHHVRPAPVVVEQAGQRPPGIPAVTEHSIRHHSS